jgi:hypothetical protein
LAFLPAHPAPDADDPAELRSLASPATAPSL